MNAEAQPVIDRLASKIGELERDLAIAEVLLAQFVQENEQLKARLDGNSSEVEDTEA